VFVSCFWKIRGYARAYVDEVGGDCEREGDRK
jgi:hypothetical protein